jgi:hypothetical protein
MTQWHPLFAALLRPMVEGHYDVHTGMSVGDAPRAADLVLLRRTTEAPPPFQGLWQHLTVWNVLEFKGPTVSARVRDLELLVELGLGIDRRLNETQRRQGADAVQRRDVSFWYLANQLGRRFLREARELLGTLEEVGMGVWRAALLGRPLLLVSNRQVPVEPDTIPVHLLVREPLEATRAVAREVATRADLWRLYSGWVAQLFPELWKEVRAMAKGKGYGPNLDWGPVLETVDVKDMLRQLGAKRVIDEMGLQTILDEVEVSQLLKVLAPEKREELKRRLK